MFYFLAYLQPNIQKKLSHPSPAFTNLTKTLENKDSSVERLGLFIKFR